jgi:hypothetical protein
MKRVKFNATTYYTLIPDEAVEELRAELKAASWKNLNEYRNMMQAIPTRYPSGVAQIGTILDVPNHYYAENCEKTVTVPHCILLKGKDTPNPYNVNDYYGHYGEEARQLLKKVKIFDLVEDLDDNTVQADTTQSADIKIDKRLKEYREQK